TTFVFKETLPPEKRRGQTTRRQSFKQMLDALREPGVGILMALMFSVRFQFGIFTAAFAPFILSRLGLDSFGSAIVFIVFGLVAVVIQGGLIGRLTDYFSERKLVFIGMALFAVGFLLMAFTPSQPVPWYSRAVVIDELSQTTGSPPEEQLALLPAEGDNGVRGLIFMILFLAPVPIGYALLQPSLSSLVTKRVEAQNVGQALGVSTAFMSAGTVLGPLVGGALFSVCGGAAPFVVNGILGIILYRLARQRLMPQPEDVYGDLAVKA
ncbi:MAG: MFS transporter, partial [Anaerolineae bacterium]|nr:MFS transporter [Anaerolineae bacterium]